LHGLARENGHSFLLAPFAVENSYAFRRTVVQLMKTDGDARPYRWASLTARTKGVSHRVRAPWKSRLGHETSGAAERTAMALDGMGSPTGDASGTALAREVASNGPPWALLAAGREDARAIARCAARGEVPSTRFR